MKLKLSLGLALLLITTLIWADDKKIWAKSFLNHKAPDLVVEKWLAAKPDTTGKFVLVDFWATWCGPCKKAIPELNDLSKKFKDKLVVIGVSNEDEQKVRDYASTHIDYNVGIDPKSRTAKILEIKGIPHIILMDPAGIVRWEGNPLSDEDPLNEKVVSDVIAKYSK